MEKEKINKKTWVLIIILLLLWGNNSTVTVMILRDMDQFQMMFLMLLGSAIFTPLIDKNVLKCEMKMEKKDWFLVLCYSLCNFYYLFGCIYALKYIPTVEAAMLNYTFPIFIVIFSVVFFKEKLNAKRVAAILLGFLGVVFLVTNGNIFSFALSNPVGDFMALSAAMVWGIFTNIGKLIKKNYNFCKYVNVILGLIMSTFIVFIMSDFKFVKIGSIIVTLFWGIVHYNIGLAIWMYLSQNLSSSVLANISFITPFVAIFSIVIFLGDKLLPAHICGGVFIFLAVFLQSRESV